MRYLFLFLLTYSLSPAAQSQTGNYRADLDALYDLLKKTPSYKDQVKGDKEPAFHALYQSLRADTLQVGNSFDNYYKLVQLFIPLRDNHLGFIQLPSIELKLSEQQNVEAVKQYRQSSFFKNYPATAINLDSLEAVLAPIATDSVEGIYYYDSLLTVGVYRAGQGALTGVVLHTTLPQWEKGQIAIRLYEYAPHCFRAVYGHPLKKNLIFYSNEKFRNHSLINSMFYSSVSQTVYKKILHETDHSNIPASEPAFQLKSISPAIQYLRLGNFSAMTKDMAVSQAFYDRIKDSLTAPYLIVDVRNNTGGADKVSYKFFALVKKYAESHKAYLLMNNATMSQGEIFTLQLKRFAGISTFGQTTMGTITYGVNYGGMATLPSGQYGAIMTDMRDNTQYLPYENYGVTPDTILNNQSDWIMQLVQVIGEK
ncbi:hypothetical protein D3H65_05030 [Paraflavitalea soli]|uniref:Uncharacterized protein n=1 Tax=Paraflavitalea soli TaxID=2315862 RepID=A0A3B7MJG8_9BACT|nr:S41 family peptidase [Paraflavitalea soli]AXY73379.1 hypothetical protein D3H65_05030 [Paraflavitalea soli]